MSFQQPGERNFHVFYQLLRGVSEDEREQLCLGPPESFRYTRTCTNLSNTELVDEEQWTRLREGLFALDIDDAQQTRLFSLLAGVLWLGQVEFALGEPQRDERNPLVMGPAPLLIVNPEAAATAARLLGVDERALMDNFERRTVQASGRETFAHVKLTIQEAEEVSYSYAYALLWVLALTCTLQARDTLARAIYGRAFDWLVGAINEAIHAPGDVGLFIGLLDIFGFENFDEHNAFEQLLINLGNERLQNLFVEHVFVLEQRYYVTEGIEWTPQSYPDS